MLNEVKNGFMIGGFVHVILMEDSCCRGYNPATASFGDTVVIPIIIMISQWEDVLKSECHIMLLSPVLTSHLFNSATPLF